MNITKLKRYIAAKLGSELSEKLTYHGIHHTLSVLNSCNQYIRRMHIPPAEAYLLRTAALMHDTGYLWSIENHEEKSMAFAWEILPFWNYSALEINQVNGMIRATKIPQSPTTLLEQIIGDADLDYLGTDSFHVISEQLFDELKNYGRISGRQEWNQLQIKFLQNHSYHTPYALKYREPVKQKHLQDLLKK
ncbi:MAG: HD domain-containing protein [Bacteroidales bacterium]|nr:HD domain-containing protein [Bacteroidales bacterium]